MMLKNLKKKIGIGLGVVAVFALGNVTGASTDLFTNAENQAYSDMLNVANDVKSDIADSASTDIETTLNTEIEATVQSSEDELRRLLEQYYQMKLDSLDDSPEFKQLEERIQQTMLNVSGSFKEQIDAIFAENGL
jgi:hypothetical protein